MPTGTDALDSDLTLAKIMLNLGWRGLVAKFVGTNGDDIFTGGGDDDEIIGNGGNDKLSGGGGSDHISGGAGSDTLDGGAGNDVIFSGEPTNDLYLSTSYGYPEYYPVLDDGAEVDTIRGGDGSDRIIAGYGDNIDGGADGTYGDPSYGDYLYISFQGAPSGVNFDFGLATQTIGGGTITGIENLSWVRGSNFDDTINANSSRSTAYALYTEIFGEGGNDHLIAGYLTSDMSGGDGDDVLDGRSSGYMSHLDGGDGNDTIYSGDGGVEIDAGNGNDQIIGSGYIHAGAGDDRITVQDSTWGTVAYGDAGNDVIQSSDRNVNIAGGAGADHITSGAGADVLSSDGFATDSTIPSPDRGAEHDVISAGGGDDVIAIGIGDDADGGAGNDQISLSLLGATAGMTIDLSHFTSGQTFSIGGGTIANVESITAVTGTGFSDQFIVGTHPDLITVNGDAGDDTLTSASSTVAFNGGSGADTLISGAAGDIFDGGDGNDTVDYSSYGSAVTVSLATGIGAGGDQLLNVERVIGSTLADHLTGSDNADTLDGRAGNDVLDGGSGTDILIGGAGADRLTGGAGNDWFAGTAAELNGDTITDFGFGDKIHLTDVAAPGFAFSWDGSVLRFGSSAITINGNGGTFTVSADASGGLDLSLVRTPVAHDFDGDGKSDLLWRNDVGHVTDWISNGQTILNGPFYRGVGNDWHIAGTGDFNGDGRADTLWRNDDGHVTDWTSNGQAFLDNNLFSRGVGNDWQVAGTGDFNGDGKTDILWRNADGQVTDWISNGTTFNDTVFRGVGNDWHIAGTGDFNGDGKADILWRNDNGAVTDWLSNGTTFTDNNAFSRSVGSDWHIAGTGDFNGDGKTDILWRNDAGSVTDWLSNGTSFTDNNAATRGVGNNWHIAGTGDFDGDGRADIAWRNDDGYVTDWTSNGTTFNDNGAFYRGVGHDWHMYV